MNLNDKLLLTQIRIRQWYEHYDGQIYVAFSGGRDSTVLLDIVRRIYPEVPAVFNNTGLEFPEIKQFVKTVDNVIWLKPRMTFREVIKKYGYALVSKEVAQKVSEIRHTKSDKLRDIRLNGYREEDNPKTGSGKLPIKWRFLIDAPFEISHKCCDVLKKNPAKSFERKTGLKPMTGEMMSESNLRRVQGYTKDCNMFDAARPISKPMMKWNTEDVKEYITVNNTPYSSIYDMGYERTGCVWCAFGADKCDKFSLLKKTHPKLYEYSMDNLGLRKPLEYIENHFKQQEQSK